jgi:hypothetical protein
VRYWNDIQERENTYADSDAVVIFPNKKQQIVQLAREKYLAEKDLAEKVLKMLGRKDITVPLLMAGLGVQKADNQYGFTFTMTDFTTATDVLYSVQDGNIRRLVVTLEGVQVFIPDNLYNQSALLRAHRGRGDSLSFGLVRLVDSDASGRVQVVQRGLKLQIPKLKK